ncbi:MAG: hypothetical protein WCV71_01015 [Patescibacteria group bacterium]|jgi:hypothetical protein
MSEQIIKLAQAEDQIINNLVNTENKLNELNQEVGVILNDYKTTNQPEVSFFNFDNPFFLLILAGLFLLAFALWFLKQELKHSKTKKTKIIAEVKEKIEIKTVPEIKVKTSEVEKVKTEPLKETPRKKGRTIKVIKIK